MRVALPRVKRTMAETKSVVRCRRVPAGPLARAIAQASPAAAASIVPATSV